MPQHGTNPSRLGGEYMIQDRNHLAEVSPVTDKANQGGVRQSEQSQSDARQQGGGDRTADRKQGARPRRNQ